MRFGQQPIADAAPRRVLLIAPTPPPYGGMAIQAGLLQHLLREDGIPTDILGYNQPFASGLRFLERVPALRTVLRAGVFWVRFWSRLRSSEVVHILAASWIYFFLIVSPAVLMGRLRGKRVILNYRGGDAGQFLKRCAWIAKPFFRMADVITTPSEFLAQVIRRRLRLGVVVVPNIIELSRFQYRARNAFQPRMLVTRHLESLYDVESILRAFRQIQIGYPAASLSIAGTGSQETRLRGLVSSWDLKNVHFLGHVNHANLPALYDRCDILLNASRTDNFPASLLEGSAAGLVVISTNAGGIPFIYENETNALLVEIGDWRGLASAVERAILQQDLAGQLAAAGARLCQKCEWHNVRRWLFAAYGFTGSPEDQSISAFDARLGRPA